MKRLLYILVLLLNTIFTYAQVKIDTSIDTISIKIGQQSHLIISVETPKQTAVVFPQYKPQAEIVKGVEVIKTSIDTVLTDDKQTLKYNLTLTAWEAGKYKIPEQTLAISQKKYNSKALQLDVVEPKVDKGAKAEMLPADEIKNNPFLWTEWLPIGGGFCLVLGLLYMAYRLYRKLKQQPKNSKNKQIVKRISPHEQAFASLEMLKTKTIENEEQEKEYYTELIDIVRSYIESRFQFSAMEMTTAEIVEHLNREEDKTLLNELHEMLSVGDLVKFAKYSTTSNDQLYYLSVAQKFVETTRQEGVGNTVYQEENNTTDTLDKPKSNNMLPIAIGVLIIGAVLVMVWIVNDAIQLLE